MCSARTWVKSDHRLFHHRGSNMGHSRICLLRWNTLIICVQSHGLLPRSYIHVIEFHRINQYCNLYFKKQRNHTFNPSESNGVSKRMFHTLCSALPSHYWNMLNFLVRTIFVRQTTFDTVRTYSEYFMRCYEFGFGLELTLSWENVHLDNFRSKSVSPRSCGN